MLGLLVELFEFSRLIIAMRCFNGLFCSLGFLYDFSCVAFLVWQGSFLCFDALYKASQIRLFWYFSWLIVLGFWAVAVFVFEFYVVAKKAHKYRFFVVVGSEFLRQYLSRARSNLWLRRFGC